MRRTFALAFCALSLAACGPAVVSGTVGGDSIDSSDAIASQNSALGINTLNVVIGGDTSDLCSDLSKGILHPSASLLSLVIVTGNLTTEQYALGTNLSQSVSAEASSLDSACGDVLHKSASGGSITLTKLTGGTIEGSFDLTFDGGDELTGSFSASLCSKTSIDKKVCQ